MSGTASGAATVAPAPVAVASAASAYYRRRKIAFTLKLQPVTDPRTGTLVSPKFAHNGKAEATFTGLRCNVVIQKFGYVSQSPLSMRVFGLPLSVMNDIATLGRLPLAGRNNTITVSAGDDEAGMSVVYTGTIQNAWADFQSAPDVALNIDGQIGLYAAQASTEATSYDGAADASVILSGLAVRMGRTFQNNGVTAQLSNPYFHGTLLDQLHSCVAAADVDFEDDGVTIFIWPKNGSRGGTPPLISPQTGLVGYPTYNRNGIALLTLYNPLIGRGGLIKVESSLIPASGLWRVYSLTHTLDSETHNGPWFSYLQASEPPYAAVR